ncbi:MAG: class I SAM-dependent methyltransferase [Nitrososphaera sp.]|jgi:SAM-dependent methyltransferase
MSEVWNRAYSSDKSFFGEEPSNFAMLCFNHMKVNNVKKVLELGAGHGRDSVFFASNGINVTALDYSSVGVSIISRLATENRLPLVAKVFDVNMPLPFEDGSFDAVYSNMVFNMRFSIEQLHSIFAEIRRVLKRRGFNFFSVRNINDKSFAKGVKVEEGIYDINGFQIRFFTEQLIQDLTEGFEIFWINEESVGQVTLYLVSSRKA